MSNLEQNKAILANAPEGATHYDGYFFLQVR